MLRPLRSFPSLLGPFLIGTMLTITAACSGGGGGGGNAGEQNTGPQLPVQVPAGSGAVSIDLVGTWTVLGAAIVESNNSTQPPPPDGVQFVLQGDRVVSVAGFEVTPANLTLLLGQLSLYVNQADGKTLFYAVTADGRAAGGSLETTALAGGSVDTNTISVEAYVSSQALNETEPRFTRSRYMLKRASTAAPAGLTIDELERDLPLADDERAVLRARLRAALGLGD